MQNKVPYNIFKKWYKDIRNKVVEVKVDDIPADEAEKEPIPVVKPHKASVSTDIPICIWAHYPLFRVAEKMNPVQSTFWVLMNVVGNAMKKIFYVKKIK